MAEKRIYLDYNATSPLRPQAAVMMLHALSLSGNASSVHREGREARALIENARDQVASFVGASPRNLTFTSGGTEANNAVLSPRLRRSGMSGDASLLVISATEHLSVLEGHGFSSDKVFLLPVRPNGVIDLDALEDALASAPGRAIVSIHTANNETGIIQPVQEAAGITHRYGGVFHTDAVQAAGRMPLDINELGVDVMTLSAHKIGGPKGAGAIILGSGAVELGGALVRGGGQERGNRSGTENIAAIAGFGAAAAASGQNPVDEQVRLRALRDRVEAIISNAAPEAVLIGRDADRLVNTVTVAFPGHRAETMLIAFDLAGVAVSSGSACSSGKVKRSHVLDAMKLDSSLSEGAIRLSLGWKSTEEDVAFFATTCDIVFNNLYKRHDSAALRAS